MTELPQDNRVNGQSPSYEWPVDILHISDLHFSGSPRLDSQCERNWAVFLNHVADDLKRFRPAVIAFTGDLVVSAGPWTLAGYRRGVNALLELARICGFLSEPVSWDKEKEFPPDAWWNLLYHRIFIVPGNHDVYIMGLRMLWQRWTKNWLKIAAPPQQQQALRSRLEPVPASTQGPLAVLMIDSNSKSAFWKYARGEVDQQLNLHWPDERKISESHFRIALMHAHPVQLPFFLQGITNAEASMTMENAGLLMKNLANLGVRLVLHGHRHYPGICTLLLPDAQGSPRSIVVVGGGSVTHPPKDWSFCTFDWIRIHADRRVEVTMVRRLEQDNAFFRDIPFLADTGDFRYDEIIKTVEIQPEGDINIVIRYIGFRVKPGRPPVNRIPFKPHLEPHAHLAAWCFRPTKGGGPGARLSWDQEGGFIEIAPAQREDFPPMDFELHYYIHNSSALTAWEAEEMYGHTRSGTLREDTSVEVLCEVGKLRLEVILPEGCADPRFSGASPRFAEVTRDRGIRDDAASVQLTEAVMWDQAARRLSTEFRSPPPSSSYTLFWHIRKPEEPPEGLIQKMGVIWLWQRSLIQRSHAGQRPLDSECQVIKQILSSDEGRFGRVGDVDVSLFVGDTNDNRRKPTVPYQLAPGSLCLVGATFALPNFPPQWNLPFGAGVVGRAFRTGRPTLYNVHRAESTATGYREKAQGRPLNYYLRFEKELGIQEYVGLLAVPVFPLEMGKKLNFDVRSARFALLVLCIGTMDLASSILTWSWRESQMDEFAQVASQQLETRVYDLLEPKVDELAPELRSSTTI